MVNDSHPTKLDEAVKQTLSNYEAGYEPSDWARMESMLDAAPKPSSFKWTHLMNGLIAVAVVGGIYLLYNALSSSVEKPEEVSKTETVLPAAEKPKPQPAVVTPNPPVVTEETPVVAKPMENPVLPLNKPAISQGTTLERPVKKTTQPASTADDAEARNIRVMEMGNEPVFGDMLDSSRGIVGETKETDETKEAAKKAKEIPVGWNSFMFSNVKPDSIRKNRELMKKDSIKE